MMEIGSWVLKREEENSFFRFRIISNISILLTTENECNVLVMEEKMRKHEVLLLLKKVLSQSLSFFLSISLFTLSSLLPPTLSLWIRSLSQRLIWISGLCLIWSNTSEPNTSSFLFILQIHSSSFSLSPLSLSLSLFSHLNSISLTLMHPRFSPLSFFHFLFLFASLSPSFLSATFCLLGKENIPPNGLSLVMFDLVLSVSFPSLLPPTLFLSLNLWLFSREKVDISG